MTQVPSVHATGLVLGAKGLVLRGPSGAGKSMLALLLFDEWEARGRKAAMVADDRLELAAEGPHLVMRPPANIAGLVELRGRGIVHRPFVTSARVHLVVDLVPVLERLVEEDELTTHIEGITLARCPVPRAGVTGVSHQLLLIREALRALAPVSPRARQKTA